MTLRSAKYTFSQFPVFLSIFSGHVLCTKSCLPTVPLATPLYHPGIVVGGTVPPLPRSTVLETVPLSIWEDLITRGSNRCSWFVICRCALTGRSNACSLAIGGFWPNRFRNSFATIVELRTCGCCCRIWPTTLLRLMDTNCLRAG